MEKEENEVDGEKDKESEEKDDEEGKRMIEIRERRRG